MRNPTQALPLLLLLVSGHALIGYAAQQPSTSPAPPVRAPKATLEEQLIGTWVLVEATTPGTPSGIGVRQKTYAAGRWEIIQKDPKTGEVIFHHGGSYRVNGDILEQKVEFATQKTRNYIGQVRKFRITMGRDTYTQVGIGNPFNEVWKRVDVA